MRSSRATPKSRRPMPKFTPAPAPLIQLFERSTAGSGVELRKMFGYPAAFSQGNMFAGLFRDSMILRLSEEDRAALARRHHALPFEPMPGRAMREYLVVPPQLLRSSADLDRWIKKAQAYARSLPPKRKRSKRASS